MRQAGKVANEQAARKASNTIRRKIADLELFEKYLQACKVSAAGLYDSPEAWRGVTWGLVEGFKLWMLQQGYAIGSINGRLSTFRTFAKLATKAEAITPDALRMIQTVQGYANKEGVSKRMG